MTPMLRTEWTRCRLCGPDLEMLFSIPAPIISAFPPAGTDLAALPRSPLDVLRCRFCGFVQLRHSVDPATLYGEYWYESGINTRMRDELAEITTAARYFLPDLHPGDAVLDIGANDGTLLKTYPDYLHRVAVEPSATFKLPLASFCDSMVQDTFPQCWNRIPHRSYKIITSIACFYDIDTPVWAAEEIRALLHPYGVWVCQFQDLDQQIRAGAWDNFCHEHIGYYTLATFRDVCQRAGLKVVDVQRSAINGGSLRVFVQRPHAPERPTVQEQLQREAETTADGRWAGPFAARIQRNVAQIRAMVEIAREAGPLALYGASTKGNTLLQVLDLPEGTVSAAWERNPRKVGRMTVTGVPIISEEEGRKDPPPALLTTIWQFKDQIIQREQETLRTTRLILPLPEATLVEILPKELVP